MKNNIGEDENNGKKISKYHHNKIVFDDAAKMENCDGINLLFDDNEKNFGNW